MASKNYKFLPVLQTRRLTLRPLLSSDDRQILALRSNATVNQYLSREPSQFVDDARKFIQAILQNQSLYWAITLTNVDELIGTICLFDLSDHHFKAELGYELLPDYWQKGMMHEAIAAVIDFAFQYLKLQVIEAYTHVDNKASSRLLERLNFKRLDTDDKPMMLFTLINQN